MIKSNPSVFDNDIMRLEWKHDILHGWYKKGTVDLERAKKIVKDRQNFTNNQDVYMIVKQEGLRGIEREARHYLSSDEAIVGIKAAAILANSAFESYLANFFINITVIRPKIPTKVFRNENEAVKWIQSLRKNSKN